MLLDLLLRVFPARTCSAGVFRRSQQIGRPCLLAYIGKCSAPCVGWVTEAEHREIVDAFCDFMSGRADPMIRKLEKEMAAAAADLDFERAARLRDDLSALRRAVEKQAVVLGDGTDADVVGVTSDDLLASVQVFHVRGGRVRGQRGWIVDVDADIARGDAAGPDPAPGATAATAVLVENFLLQFYGGRATDDGATAVPREVLVPVLPANPEDVTAWLSGLRGSRVSLRVARRGDKRALAETVTRNAAEALSQHRLKRASDLTARSAALTELAQTLGMDTAPLRIECIDISHVQGTDVVASLVVFEDGLAKRSDYRHFAIREHPGDDVASIAEVVRRRFAHGAGSHPADHQHAGGGEPGRTDHADAAAPRPADGQPDPPPTGSRPGIDPLTGRPRRFAYPPQLLVVDGGAPQVNAAAAVLADLHIADITVCGLAKRLEEVWMPSEDDPVIFPRTSEALYLLQRLRDEAHRFAITYHRSKRSRSMTVSALDSVPGLGPIRRTALVKHFGSLSALRKAGAQELCEVPGIGASTAEAIVTALTGVSQNRSHPVDSASGAATTGGAATTDSTATVDTVDTVDTTEREEALDSDTKISDINTSHINTSHINTSHINTSHINTNGA